MPNVCGHIHMRYGGRRVLLDEEMRGDCPQSRRHPHGCDPRPSTRIVGEDVLIGRAFVVRHPTRCYAPTSDEFVKDQGDGRRLPWGPLADGHLNRRWPPSPVPRHMACELHVLDKWGFALVVVADEEPRAPRPATGWCHLLGIRGLVYRLSALTRLTAQSMRPKRHSS